MSYRGVPTTEPGIYRVDGADRPTGITAYLVRCRVNTGGRRREIERTIVSSLSDAKALRDSLKRSLLGADECLPEKAPRAAAPTVQEVVSNDRAMRELRELKRREAEMVALIESLENELGVKRALAESVAQGVPRIERKGSSANKREATACLLVSDAHFEESVSRAATSGMNEYNLEIAERRVDKLIQGALWHVDHHRHAYDIRTLLLWLGGDIINGVLRDEDLMNNLLSPVPAVMFAQKRLTQLIQAMLDYGGFEEIIIPCSTGNHGRLTLKPVAKKRCETSLEMIIYTQLAQYFSRDERVKFVISTSEVTYQEVYGFVFRFMHGDSIRFRDAIGGIWTSFNKRVMNLDKSRRADVTCIGHFHNYASLPYAVTNGSLVGWNEYAQHLCIPYEPPQQAFFLIDAQRGMRQSDRIWVDDSEE